MTLSKWIVVPVAIILVPLGAFLAFVGAYQRSEWFRGEVLTRLARATFPSMPGPPWRALRDESLASRIQRIPQERFKVETVWYCQRRECGYDGRVIVVTFPSESSGTVAFRCQKLMAASLLAPNPADEIRWPAYTETSVHAQPIKGGGVCFVVEAIPPDGTPRVTDWNSRDYAKTAHMIGNGIMDRLHAFNHPKKP